MKYIIVLIISETKNTFSVELTFQISFDPFYNKVVLVSATIPRTVL